MATTTNYQPVTAIDTNGNMKEAATTMATTRAAPAAGGSSPGLWTKITNALPFLKTKRGIAVAVIAILVIIGGGLAGLAALRNRSNKTSGSGDTSGGGTNANAITNDVYFYGQSPPVYPSRECFLPSLLVESFWCASRASQRLTCSPFFFLLPC